MKMRMRMLLIAMVLTFTASTLQAGYLDRLKPVLELRFDKEAKAEVELADGVVLRKSPIFADTFPKLLKGPHEWTGNAWDFSTCEGVFLLKSDATMAKVGDPKSSDGMTVSFWIKGEYSGKKCRVMTGPFDITAAAGIYGATYTVSVGSDKKFNPWDKKWHHVAVLIDFRTTRDNVRMYIDGKITGTTSATFLKTINPGLGKDWAFGGRHAHDAGFDYGALADIAVFDRPLSDNEINYIVNGPVYAGNDQEVTIPNILKLDGLTSGGGKVFWKQIAGPEKAQMKYSTKEKALVKFAVPGDYTFQLMAGKYKSEINVKVLPNQPPKVFAGSGLVINSKKPTTKLQGKVEDFSVARGQTVTSEWTVVEAPKGGAAEFANPKSPVTDVTLKGSGLFTLRLTATDGELSAKSDVSVLFSDGKETSYVQLLRPLFFIGFEEPARKTIELMIDDTGSTGMRVRRPENGTPVMKKGARPYTGYAWDFSVSDSDLEIINGDHFIPISSQNHPGRSMSYWLKSDAPKCGHICSLWGFQNLQRGGFVSMTQHMPSLTHKPDNDILDGQWHHFAEIVTSIDKKFTKTLYLDGKEVVKVESPIERSWWTLGTPSHRHPKYIASRGRSGNDNLLGQLDDFAIFDYALTSEDVAYLYNGPTDADKANLKLAEKTNVDAGKNHYIQLPASYKVKLNGKAPKIRGLKPQWQKISGDGTVAFSPADSAATVASFEPVEDDKDGKYSKFILRLSLVDDHGKVFAADDITVLFHPKRAPEIRKLSKTPPAGEHPRIYFTIVDLPELRLKAISVPVAKRAFEAMSERAAALDNPKSGYGNIYHAALEGGTFSTQLLYGYNQGGYFLSLSEAAYVNWLGENGQSNSEKLKELATVFSASCKETLTWYKSQQGNPLCGDVNWAVGLAYDLLYNYMDKVGRDDARHLISRTTSYRNSVGSDSSPQANSSNWKGYHDHLFLTALAIEGEKGFDVGVFDSAERKDSIFLTQYGVFKSGLPHEGYGYFSFGMHWMSPLVYAVSRRDNRENLAETTRFYKVSGETALRLLDKDGIRHHHDANSDPISGAGLAPLPPRQLMVAKYLWPEDRMIDYVWAQLSRNLMKDEDRRFDIFHAFLGEPVKYPGQTLAEAGGQTQPTIFCPDRGFMMARDKWDKDAIRLDFRCRMDKYELGHVHADCNAFEMWANNRAWFIDLGRNNGAGTYQEAQSGILIDGIGSHSSKRNSWPSTPGKFVEFKDDEIASIGCGDAKPFYDLSRDIREGKSKVEHENYADLMWSDYYLPREGEKMPEWMKETPMTMDGYGKTWPLYKMNPVQRAFRTAALVKGVHPFVVIVDDFQKDDKPHEYKWFANVPFKGSMEVVKEGRDFLILKHKEDADGPFMLVKVINTDGLKSIKLNRESFNKGAKGAAISERVEIIADKVVAPDFQILLYPCKQGDPLPKVSKVKDGYKISIGGQIRNINMKKGTDARTTVTVTK